MSAEWASGKQEDLGQDTQELYDKETRVLGSPEMSENSSALKFCSPSRGRLMKACMAGERTMAPLLACLSRLSRYLQGEGAKEASSHFCHHHTRVREKVC